MVYAATCNTKLPLVAAGFAAGGVAAGALRPSSNASARAPSSVRVSGLAAGLGSGLGSGLAAGLGSGLDGCAAADVVGVVPAGGTCGWAVITGGGTETTGGGVGMVPWDPPRGGAGRLARALRGRHGRRDLRLAYLGLERRVAFRHLDGDIVRNRNRLGIEHHGQHDDGRQDQRDRACQPAPRTAAQLRRLHFAGHGRPFGGLRLVGRIFAFEKPMEENSLRRLSADGAAACRHLADEPNLAPIARALAYALRPRACKTEATVRNDPNTTILSFSAARSRAAEKAAAGSA